MNNQIIAYIKKEILAGQDNLDLTPEDSLLEEGLIDSLGVMRLVAFLEEEFDVKIPPQDLTIENFITVQAITTYLETINRKKAHE